MERILLPLTGRAASSDATILQWHITEGTLLASHSPLVTVQIDTLTRQYVLRREERGFVVKHLAVKVGERVGSDGTLALVGLPAEPLPDGLDIEAIPPFGTGTFMSRRLTYVRMLRYTLFCAGLLLALQIWIGPILDSAGRAAPGILLALHRALDMFLPAVFGCLFTPIVLTVSTLLLCLMPPEPKRMLGVRHVLPRPDP